MKLTLTANDFSVDEVAPLVGAWIEITFPVLRCNTKLVAPLVGAWIEILMSRNTKVLTRSLPLWERGLKCPFISCVFLVYFVAPLVGAWIEINLLTVRKY